MDRSRLRRAAARSGPRGRDGRDGLRGHAESARQGTGVQGGAVLQTSAGGHRQQNHGYNLRARSTENQIAQRHDPLSRDFATPLSGRFSVPAALPLSPRLVPRSPGESGLHLPPREGEGRPATGGQERHGQSVSRIVLPGSKRGQRSTTDPRWGPDMLRARALKASESLPQPRDEQNEFMFTPSKGSLSSRVVRV